MIELLIVIIVAALILKISIRSVGDTLRRDRFIANPDRLGQARTGRFCRRRMRRMHDRQFVALLHALADRHHVR